MTKKLVGKIKFFNNQKSFGVLIDQKGNEIRFNRENCLTPPINNEKVYFLRSTENPQKIQQIEGEYAYYFKNIVFNLSDSNYDEFCDKALEYAGKLKSNKVTTSMIRKVYDQLIRAESMMEIKRLRPQLAYIAGRNSDKSRVGELMHILDDLAKHGETNSEKEKEQLDNIKQFMEAIVAYLKYVGE